MAHWCPSFPARTIVPSTGSSPSVSVGDLLNYYIWDWIFHRGRRLAYLHLLLVCALPIIIGKVNQCSYFLLFLPLLLLTVLDHSNWTILKVQKCRDVTQIMKHTHINKHQERDFISPCPCSKLLALSIEHFEYVRWSESLYLRGNLTFQMKTCFDKECNLPWHDYRIKRMVY